MTTGCMAPGPAAGGPGAPAVCGSSCARGGRAAAAGPRLALLLGAPARAKRVAGAIGGAGRPAPPMSGPALPLGSAQCWQAAAFGARTGDFCDQLQGECAGRARGRPKAGPRAPPPADRCGRWAVRRGAARCSAGAGFWGCVCPSRCVYIRVVYSRAGSGRAIGGGGCRAIAERGRQGVGAGPTGRAGARPGPAGQRFAPLPPPGGDVQRGARRWGSALAEGRGRASEPG
jgi:hypothetical protein